MSNQRVNAHTHLELGWAAPLAPKKEREFTSWQQRLLRRGQLIRQSPNAEERYTQAVTAGIKQLIKYGTTHVGDVSQTGASIEPLMRSKLKGTVYLEIAGLEEGVSDFMFGRATQIIDQFGHGRRSGIRLGIAISALYSIDQVTLRDVAAYTAEHKLPLCIHVAETPAEIELAVNNQGPLQALPFKLGGTIPSPSIGARPVEYLAQTGILNQSPTLIHAVHVTDYELDLIANAKAAVVACPRSNQLLSSGTFPIQAALQRDIRLALGTESLAAVQSLDVCEESKLLQPQLTPSQIQKLLQNKEVLG